MKNCQNCGAENPDFAATCSKCGSKFETAPDVQPSTVPSVQHSTNSSIQLSTNRGLLKFVLLSIITLGIYAIVVMSKISTDINVIASEYDGKKTMHFCLVVFIFSWLTLGIVPLVWNHNLCNRIGNELARRNIDYKFGAGTFWGWGFLGMIILVGPFVYIHKLLNAMNLLSADYNAKG